MDNITSFECPTQVKFWDADNLQWRTGIAYQNEIICSCCGGIIELEDVRHITTLSWVDLTQKILGIEDICPTDEEMCEMEAHYYAEQAKNDN